MTRKLLRSIAPATLLAVTIASSVQAQGQPTPTAPTPVMPLKVTITIGRYQGEKKISSLPYVLSLNMDPTVRSQLPAGQTSLRNGTRVPIASTTTGGGTPTPTITYQDVGTFIDCNVSTPDEAGRFKLQVTIDESSVYDDPAAKNVVQIGRPTLRTFRTNGSLMLKDGQSAEMSNTPDKMTGEIVKVDVALAVIK